MLNCDARGLACFVFIFKIAEVTNVFRAYQLQPAAKFGQILQPRPRLQLRKKTSQSTTTLT